MTCSAIMNPHPITLRASDTVATALDKTLAHRVKSLPVLDDKGRYLGMFGLHHLLGQMLPKVARLEEGLGDLAFVSDMIEQMREKMDAIRQQPVSALIDGHTAPIHPETSLTEAVLLLYRNGENLAVVERDSGRLAGLISPWEVLAKLA
ncbi:MAG: CBS domain-containing protein [Burkholderiales bacterium]|nr:CBS domain-containing protein [Sulfuricellaceae bacterium]